ncbi:methylenetetrahydromethanopterin dehydrogenase [bacterium]|nr:methylenetetrahydromethanopterin dehydrogenase [bacterium]
MKKILIQLDTDAHPSSFDKVVAVDSDVDHIFSYGGVTADNVEGLVHGAIFTRGPKSLCNTAIFVGGSNVSAGEDVFAKVQKTFFGPMRVSVMMDSNGSNTTAAAAVLAAANHLDLSTTTATVLGGTGPVGLRAAQLLAARGTAVRLVSRSAERATSACDAIAADSDAAKLTPVGASGSEIQAACEGSDLLIAAGAAGVQFLSADEWQQLSGLKVAVDVNAVPPVGLEGIEVMDKATDRNGITTYGAIGVGGTKMKIHKAAVRKLFESNDAVMDTESIYKLAESL